MLGPNSSSVRNWFVSISALFCSTCICANQTVQNHLTSRAYDSYLIWQKQACKIFIHRARPKFSPIELELIVQIVAIIITIWHLQRSLFLQFKIFLERKTKTSLK